LLDTNEGLNGKKINDVLPLTDKEGNKVDIYNEFHDAKGMVKRDDLFYAFDDKEVIRLEITFSPIRSSYSRSKKAETHDGYIAILSDVTKSKSLEEERDEFISVVSHELRTPITIAEGTISNVQVMMDHPDITPKMLKDSIDTAHDQIMFLAKMVNDLGTLSRAERGVADTAEDIDVKELAAKLLDLYTDEAKEKKLHLNLDLGPKVGVVHTSRLYIEELLQNLITNAIKYTKKGSVTIIIKQKANKITFAVKDTGIGISKSDQSKVFGKFYRSEDYRTRETGGTGLGLYVASKLASKIGVKIELVSRLNFGSTFSFVIPAKEKEKK
ncbi:MAG TPA: HAMP domain-containing sensor histidine kinase, partial [Candidatus Saccharibacteria bacterium]|nr:HAMP domain-containing sensor histidine kinase [Candidatus Saccharibacteria bacterium]